MCHEHVRASIRTERAWAGWEGVGVGYTLPPGSLFGGEPYPGDLNVWATAASADLPPWALVARPSSHFTGRLELDILMTRASMIVARLSSRVISELPKSRYAYLLYFYFYFTLLSFTLLYFTLLYFTLLYFTYLLTLLTYPFQNGF